VKKIYKALIIDDEKPARQAVKALGRWSELGIDSLYEAVEGTEGLAILREFHPEIVLVDMKMPKMNGARFLELASSEAPAVKLIVISGYDDFEYAKYAIKARVIDYLLKPLNASELNQSLKHAIEELQTGRLLEAETNKRKIEEPSSLLLVKEEALLHGFESNDLQLITDLIDDCFLVIEDSERLSPEYLKKTAHSFLVLLEKIALHFKVPYSNRLITDFLYNCRPRASIKAEDLRAAVYSDIAEISALIEAKLNKSDHRFLYQIKEYIDQNYFREIKLSHFAKEYFLSKEYISKLFKHEFGYNIYEYVLKVRMEKACALLSDPEIKITTIAEHLGYKDNNYFSRAFKNYYGVSPTEFRTALP